MDSAAGTANSQALTIQGNASGIPVPVSGSLSATIGGFTPTPSYSVESVTTTSVAYALPTGTVVVFYNTGANAITVKLGSSAVSVMAGQADIIQAGSWQAFTVGSSTYYAVVGNGGRQALSRLAAQDCQQAVTAELHRRRASPAMPVSFRLARPTSPSSRSSTSLMERTSISGATASFPARRTSPSRAAPRASARRPLPRTGSRTRSTSRRREHRFRSRRQGQGPSERGAFRLQSSTRSERRERSILASGRAGRVQAWRR